MKHFTTLFAISLLAAGCSTQSPSTADRQSGSAAPLAPHAAAALAFDPPIAQAEGMPDLSRTNRGPAALIGFEEPQTSSYDVYTYNRQASGLSSYYDREAVTEQSGTTHR